MAATLTNLDRTNFKRLVLNVRKAMSAIFQNPEPLTVEDCEAAMTEKVTELNKRFANRVYNTALLKHSGDRSVTFTVVVSAKGNVCVSFRVTVPTGRASATKRKEVRGGRT